MDQGQTPVPGAGECFSGYEGWPVLWGYEVAHPWQAAVDGLKRLQAETAAEPDASLPSILDKAFKGEL